VTKDQAWLLERAERLRAVLHTLGVQVTHDESVALVTANRQALAQSRYQTPAAVRSRVTDAVLTSWAEAVAQQRRRAAAPGGFRSVDLRTFAMTLSGLLEGSTALAYDGSQCGVVDVLAAATVLTGQLVKDADPRVAVCIDASVLLRAVDGLAVAVRALERAADDERDGYRDDLMADMMIDEDLYDGPVDGDVSRISRSLTHAHSRMADIAAELTYPAMERIAELRALAARLETTYVGPAV